LFLSLIVALVFLSLIVAVVVLSLSLPSLPCLQVCAWTNATLGASSGCGVSNSAEVSAYQIGLYLTLPAMLVAGLFFLAAARWQPADHKARKHNSPVFVTMALAHRLLPVTRDPCDSFFDTGQFYRAWRGFLCTLQAMIAAMSRSSGAPGGDGVRDPMLQAVRPQASDRSIKQANGQASSQASNERARKQRLLPSSFPSAAFS